MSGHRRMKWRVAGVVAALLVLVGCSALPTAPRLQRGATPPTGTSVTVVPDPGTPVSDSLDDSGWTGLPILEPIGTVTDSVGIGQIVPVIGRTGGVIRMWGMTLVVPADAIGGDATVTVRMLNSDEHECSFEINPPSLNHFSKPVTLQFDIPEATDLRGMSIYWWDPANVTWVPIPSAIDQDKKTISSDLEHFSKYKVASELMGKAGW